MIPAEVIRRKRDGNELSAEEIGFLVSGCSPTTRGSDSRPSARSSVTWSGVTPRGTETRFGFSPFSSSSCT